MPKEHPIIRSIRKRISDGVKGTLVGRVMINSSEVSGTLLDASQHPIGRYSERGILSML
jgi:hypothetical protein